ncbi:MAG: hypothetical protein WBM63_03700, partial [Sedimenticolaceae bacterium]
MLNPRFYSEPRRISWVSDAVEIFLIRVPRLSFKTGMLASEPKFKVGLSPAAQSHARFILVGQARDTASAGIAALL